jgi:hypothetical protein
MICLPSAHDNIQAPCVQTTTLHSKNSTLMTSSRSKLLAHRVIHYDQAMLKQKKIYIHNWSVVVPMYNEF